MAYKLFFFFFNVRRIFFIITICIGQCALTKGMLTNAISRWHTNCFRIGIECKTHLVQLPLSTHISFLLLSLFNLFSLFLFNNCNWKLLFELSISTMSYCTWSCSLFLKKKLLCNCNINMMLIDSLVAHMSFFPI